MKITCAAVAALALLVMPALADQKLDEAVAKADEQFQKGKTEDALKTLGKACSQNSGPECQVALARLQERAGMLAEAAATLGKTAEAGPTAPAPARAEALAALASMDLRRGSGRDALAHATAAVDLQATPSTLASLARAQARASDASKALETAERAVQAGASALAHEARGEALLALHRNDEAAGAFRKALELDPRLQRARVGLASALLAQGKAAEAATEALKASEADPKLAEAFAVLGTARLAENPNNWNDAIAQAQQGAFLNDRSAPIQYAVGKIFEANGNLDQASLSYKKAAEVDASFVPAHSALVYVQVRRGDLDGALAAAKKLAEESPQSGEAQLQLGRVLLRKSEFAEAVEALEKAAKLSPNVAEVHALLGTAYQYTRRTAEAEAGYRRAMELAPTNTDYMTTYGLLLGAVGKHAEGVAMLKKVVATPGYKSADGWLNLGWVYRNMKPPRTDESVAAYKKALEIDPKNAQAALGMGWAYSYTRLWDQAIAAFRKAAEIDPKVAGEANDGIAWCFFFKKDMPQARAYLEKAQAAGRNDTRLKENIEKVERLLAAGKKAEEEIEKVEGPKEKDEGPDLPALTRDLKSTSVNVRLRAAREMAATGAAGALYLGYSVATDPDIGVREVAVKSLSTMGCAAKAAIPQLKDAAAQRPAVNLNPTPAESKMELREADLRKAVTALLEKLQKC